MEYKNLVPAILMERVTRFSAKVRVRGQTHLAHVPNTGRLEELMQPGARVYLNSSSARKRKTIWDLVLVRAPQSLVAIDSRLSNSLFMEALEKEKVVELRGTEIEKREVNFGKSRLDFQLCSSNGPILVEVKSVNLVKNGLALFPDAPTTRGSRHIDELIKAQEEGARGVLFFSVQREDGEAFSPHYSMDPVFGEKVEKAVQSGVMVLAYKCEINVPRISLTDRIEVKFNEVGD